MAEEHSALADARFYWSDNNILLFRRAIPTSSADTDFKAEVWDIKSVYLSPVHIRLGLAGIKLDCVWVVAFETWPIAATPFAGLFASSRANRYTRLMPHLHQSFRSSRRCCRSHSLDTAAFSAFRLAFTSPSIDHFFHATFLLILEENRLQPAQNKRLFLTPGTLPKRHWYLVYLLYRGNGRCLLWLRGRADQSYVSHIQAR